LSAVLFALRLTGLQRLKHPDGRNASSLSMATSGWQRIGSAI
jgi:hypothetical protein